MRRDRQQQKQEPTIGVIGMVQTGVKLMNLDEFLHWYPDGCGRFELRDGVAIEMQPTGPHERVAGEVAAELTVEIRRSQLALFIPRQCIVRSIDSEKSGYNPDVIVLDEKALEAEPLWKKRSTIINGKTARLIVEVASTNWQDDYLTKLAEYEKMGIPEYWSVDYLGLGGRRYIGNPKRPTLSVYQLIEGEYQVNQFRGDNRIESSAFPELNLTAQQIFKVGQEVGELGDV